MPPKGPLASAVPHPMKLATGCAACAVRDMSVCSALSAQELERLEAITTRVEMEPQFTVFYEGDAAKYLFNVTSGVVKVYKLLADGRRQITGFFFPGDFLGLALYDHYTYTAEAVDKATLCRFPRRQFEHLLDEFPKLEKRLLQTASNELAAAQDQMLLLGRKTAQERIATFLLSLSDRATRRGQRTNVLKLPMSRSDIGDYLGLTIETVSRHLTRLKKSGAVDLPNAQEIRILHRPALLEFAGLSEEDTLATAAGF